MDKDKEEIRRAVEEGYAKAAQEGSSCCTHAPSCCGSDIDPAKFKSVVVGYDPGELATLPEGAILGLGCGNPVALAELREGETVLDLGSGPGMDCLLASQRVGPEGRVIGVDMTDDMLELARRNAEEGGFTNVEFRKGIIEELPVGDASVDVIISNCVINLSPEKPRVFADAFRALVPGGRLMVSDVVLVGELPPEVRESVYEYVQCVAGASQREDYLRMIEEAGFEGVEVLDESHYSGYPMVRSIKVRAVKPGG